jgi:hypothetical protein
LAAFRWLDLFCTQEQRQQVRTIILMALATHEVGDIPGRWEPSRVKRRPKKYAWLNQPRAQAQPGLRN